MTEKALLKKINLLGEEMGRLAKESEKEGYEIVFEYDQRTNKDVLKIKKL